MQINVQKSNKNKFISFISELNKSIYIKKDTKNINYFYNITFWIINVAKEIFKWLYAISLFKENKALFGLLFFPPFFKFIFISLGSLKRFKVNFHGSNPLIILIVIFLLIECFYELPMHFLFPVNKIYMHTNYYRIYDKREVHLINLLIVAIESIVILFFLVWYFAFGNFHYSAVVIFILDVICILFYICFEIYNCCPYDYTREENKNIKDEPRESERRRINENSALKEMNFGIINTSFDKK